MILIAGFNKGDAERWAKEYVGGEYRVVTPRSAKTIRGLSATSLLIVTANFGGHVSLRGEGRFFPEEFRRALLECFLRQPEAVKKRVQGMLCPEGK